MNKLIFITAEPLEEFKIKLAKITNSHQLFSIYATAKRKPNKRMKPNYYESSVIVTSTGHGKAMQLRHDIC